MTDPIEAEMVSMIDLLTSMSRDVREMRVELSWGTFSCELSCLSYPVI